MKTQVLVKDSGLGMQSLYLLLVKISIASAYFSACLILALEEELLMLFKGGIFAFPTSVACWVSRPGGWWVIRHVGFAQYGFLSTPSSTSQVTTAGCSGLKSWRAGGEKVTLAWLKLKARNYICLMVCVDPNLPCVVPQKWRESQGQWEPLPSHRCHRID